MFMAHMNRTPQILLLLAVASALTAHGLLWLDLPLLIKSASALVLAGLLPGLLLVELLVGNPTAGAWANNLRSSPNLGEGLLYAIGAGYGVIVLVMLVLSYLPGPVQPWMTYIAFDAVLAILFVLVWLRARETNRGGRREPGSSITPKDQRLLAYPLAGMIVLLTISSLLRFTNLGYAEFHGDEARAVLRAAALLQGNEDVLFVHKKGPTEILLPALLLSLTGQVTEATARLPLAIANLAALCAVWLLGARLLGPLAGWIAALLLAMDGYLIAFSRFLQYQSIVLLASVLAVLIFYRLFRQPYAPGRFLTLAAILLATGLLSHYDAIAAGAPALLLLGALLRTKHGAARNSLWRSVGMALFVGALLAGLFYVPFVLHPRFEATYTYLVDQRFVAGQQFPYNNLADVFRRSLVYNAGVYVAFMIGATVLALVLAYRRGWGRFWGAAFGLIPILLVPATLWRADWLRISLATGAGAAAQRLELDLTMAPFALAFALAWFAPKLRLEERLLWLWLGLLMLVAFFFTAYARTHIYVYFAPWALLVGGLLAEGWHWLHQRAGRATATVIGLIVAGVMIVLFGSHGYWYFVYNQSEILRNQIQGAGEFLVRAGSPPDPADDWLSQDAVEVDSLYGFPLANGWKVIGVLYRQGVLQGDYETNQRYAWIPDWYTRSQHRCASTAQWYFAIDNLEPWAQKSKDIEDALEEQGYARWGQVLVNAAPRLVIWQLGGDPTEPGMQIFRLEEYEPLFDQLAGPDLKLRYPIIEDEITYPLHVNFDNQVWLEGYNLEYTQPLQPGDSFRLTLFWRAQRPIPVSYKVFNQSYYADGVMVAQKDSFSVCDREPTTTWTPGKLITDIYDMTVASDAPPGVYPLYSGLYLEENFVRMPILDAEGNPVSDQFHVTDLQIGRP
jgi:hypothetical protein